MFVTNPAVLMISPNQSLVACRGLHMDHVQERDRPGHMVWNNSLSLTYLPAKALTSEPSARDASRAVRLGLATSVPSGEALVVLGKYPGPTTPPSFGVDAWHSCRPTGRKESATGPEDPRLFYWQGKPHLLQPVGSQ